MTKSIAKVFCDTNLFLQCQPLKDLPWASWTNHDEIHLMICRSVQRELDKLKATRDQAIAARARQTLRMLRTLITGECDHVLVCEERSIVRLYLVGPGNPSTELDEVLDYNKPDDEFVGHTYRYTKEHPDEEVILLTHDTGPMLTAKSLSISFREVPDDWLIGSQQESADPETLRLKRRVRELEQQEPRFDLTFRDNSDEPVDVVQIDYPVYEPMSRSEIDECIEMIRAFVPMQTEFEQGVPERRVESSLLRTVTAIRGTYVPPTEEEVRQYQESAYPHWLSECESYLSDLHSVLQTQVPQPCYVLTVENVGTRPARDALITLTAKGAVQIAVEEDIDTYGLDERQDNREGLPSPPRVPVGRWTGPFGQLSSMVGGMEGLASLHRSAVALSSDGLQTPSYLPGAIVSARHDPNGFYYKPHRPTDPTDIISLECEQWRHKSDAEDFEFLVFFDHDEQETDGAIECEIHAENLTTPVSLIVPVRIRTTRTDMAPVARELARRLRHMAR